MRIFLRFFRAAMCENVQRIFFGELWRRCKRADLYARAPCKRTGPGVSEFIIRLLGGWKEKRGQRYIKENEGDSKVVWCSKGRSFHLREEKLPERDATHEYATRVYRENRISRVCTHEQQTGQTMTENCPFLQISVMRD